MARYRPGSARARHRPILLAMAGGPGQCALPLAEQFRSNLPASALRGADLVVMDPRGTGASGALDCSTIQRAGSASALSLADCARSLGPRARLYSTSATVADIEALRRALAAPRISIYAISYGTYVAQRYALAHPHAVDRLLLDSAIPLSTDPTDHDPERETSYDQPHQAGRPLLRTGDHHAGDTTHTPRCAPVAPGWRGSRC